MADECGDELGDDMGDRHVHGTAMAGRRQALRGLGLAAAQGAFGCGVVATPATAQGVAAPGAGVGARAGQDGLRPYLQVKPVEGEGQVVRVFFSPSCAFSRAYFGFFRNLQATLPQGRRFEMSVVVNQGDGLAYALAFETVASVYPAHVANFVEASMLGVQERGLGASNWRAIERFGAAARIPRPLPAVVHERLVEARARVERAMERQRALAITNTPAVAVAGTYIATPEFTNGDATAFSQLVNGLISMTG